MREKKQQIRTNQRAGKLNYRFSLADTGLALVKRWNFRWLNVFDCLYKLWTFIWSTFKIQINRLWFKWVWFGRRLEIKYMLLIMIQLFENALPHNILSTFEPCIAVKHKKHFSCYQFLVSMYNMLHKNVLTILKGWATFGVNKTLICITFLVLSWVDWKIPQSRQLILLPILVPCWLVF